MEIQRSIALRVLRGELAIGMSATQLTDFVEQQIANNDERSKVFNGSNKLYDDALVWAFCRNVAGLPWIG